MSQPASNLVKPVVIWTLYNNTKIAVNQPCNKFGISASSYLMRLFCTNCQYGEIDFTTRNSVQNRSRSTISASQGINLCYFCDCPESWLELDFFRIIYFPTYLFVKTISAYSFKRALCIWTSFIYSLRYIHIHYSTTWQYNISYKLKYNVHEKSSGNICAVQYQCTTMRYAFCRCSDNLIALVTASGGN